MVNKFLTDRLWLEKEQMGRFHDGSARHFCGNFRLVQELESEFGYLCDYT